LPKNKISIKFKKTKGKEGSSLPFTLTRREAALLRDDNGTPHYYYHRWLLKKKKKKTRTRRGPSHPFFTIGQL
jgi:hypothetical protein